MINDEVSFIFTNEDENTEDFFQGYCFYDNDYIYGNIGYQKFNEATGKKIYSDNDGCYVMSEWRDGTRYFYTDYSGFKAIFYFWTDKCWAVSNSLVLIADYMKKKKISMLPNYLQLESIAVLRASLFNQLFSLNTFIKGVRILPRGCVLSIDKNQCTIYRSVMKNLDKIHIDNYTQLLVNYINVWCSRLATLIKDKNIFLQSDLTGGVDSRTLFSLLKKTCDLINVNTIGSLPVINTGFRDDKNVDFRIAKIITERFSFPHNKKCTIVKKKYTGKESYEVWKKLCLGVYYPIYFNNVAPSSTFVQLGGGRL